MIHKIYTVRKNFIIGCEIIHFLNNNRYKCSRRCRKDCISNSNHYGYESITDVSIDYLLGLEKNMNLDVTGLDTEQIWIFTDLAEHSRKEKKQDRKSIYRV